MSWWPDGSSIVGLGGSHQCSNNYSHQLFLLRSAECLDVCHSIAIQDVEKPDFRSILNLARIRIFLLMVRLAFFRVGLIVLVIMMSRPCHEHHRKFHALEMFDVFYTFPRAKAVMHHNSVIETAVMKGINITCMLRRSSTK